MGVHHYAVTCVLFTFARVGVVKLWSWYLSVCPLTYVKNHVSKLHQIFYACCMYLSLGPVTKCTV